MSKLPIKNKILLIALLSACVAGAAFGGMYVLVRGTQAALAKQDEEVGALAAKAQADQAVRSLVRDTEERRRELESRFIFSSEIVDFLEEIEGLANLTGAHVTIRSVNEGEGEATLARNKTITHPKLTISLGAEGSWAAVYHTLVALESLPYAVRVEQVTLDVDPTNGTWVAAVRFNVAMQ